MRGERGKERKKKKEGRKKGGREEKKGRKARMRETERNDGMSSKRKMVRASLRIRMGNSL